MRRITLVVDVSDVAVGSEFEIPLLVTYWNGLQEPKDTWLGVPLWSESEEASVLIIWPEAVEQPTVRAFTGRLRNLKAPDVDASAIGFLEQDRSRGYSAWHIPKVPGQGVVAKLKWTWSSSPESPK